MAVNNSSLSTEPSASGGAHSITPDTTAPQNVTPDNSQPTIVTGQVAAPLGIATDNSTSPSNPQDSLAAQDEALQKMAKLNHQSADATPDAHPSGKRNDEIFPQTRARSMDANEVSLMNAAKLQYAINEMFARYGFVFQNRAIQNQFEKFGWYQPKPNCTQKDILAQFSQLEVNNLNLLLDAVKNLSVRGGTNSANGTISARKHSKSAVKVYSPREKFPPDIIGKGVAGSFVVIGEAIGGGAIIVPSEDAMFSIAARKFIVQNKSSGFPPGAVIPIDQQKRWDCPSSDPLIIIAKGPLPGFYTVAAP